MLEPDPDPLSTKKSSIRIKEMWILITGILRSIAKGDDKIKPNYTKKIIVGSRAVDSDPQKMNADPQPWSASPLALR